MCPFQISTKERCNLCATVVIAARQAVRRRCPKQSTTGAIGAPGTIGTAGTIGITGTTGTPGTIPGRQAAPAVTAAAIARLQHRHRYNELLLLTALLSPVFRRRCGTRRAAYLAHSPRAQKRTPSGVLFLCYLFCWRSNSSMYAFSSGVNLRRVLITSPPFHLRSSISSVVPITVTLSCLRRART